MTRRYSELTPVDEMMAERLSSDRWETERAIYADEQARRSQAINSQPHYLMRAKGSPSPRSHDSTAIHKASHA